MEATTPLSPLINLAFTGSALISTAFAKERVCCQNFLRDFAAACREMSPLVEFTARALGQKY